MKAQLEEKKFNLDLIQATQFLYFISVLYFLIIPEISWKRYIQLPEPAISDALNTFKT